MDNTTRLEIFRKAAFCRAFEDKVFDKIKQKTFGHGAIYLSAGEEIVPATLSTICELKGLQPNIFPQHRGHSTYLAFGGDPAALRDELLGLATGCAKGMGGSASIHCPEKNIYGHDGLLGSQVPIAVGHCHATKKLTFAIMGDAAVEEDYVLASFGYAATKKLPILFLVEDNNLSVLTEKSVRRNWDIIEVAKGFGLHSQSLLEGSSIDIAKAFEQALDNLPAIINIPIWRLYWHAGAGIDQNENSYDRLVLEEKGLDTEIVTNIYHNAKLRVEELWE